MVFYIYRSRSGLLLFFTVWWSGPYYQSPRNETSLFVISKHSKVSLYDEIFQLVWIFLFCIDTTLENIAISSDRHGCVMSWYQLVIKDCKTDYFISKLYFCRMKPLHIWVIHILFFETLYNNIMFILKILFVTGMQVERYPGEILTLQDLNHSAMTTGIWRW